LLPGSFELVGADGACELTGEIDLWVREQGSTRFIVLGTRYSRLAMASSKSISRNGEVPTGFTEANGGVPAGGCSLTLDRPERQRGRAGPARNGFNSDGPDLPSASTELH